MLLWALEGYENTLMSIFIRGYGAFVYLESENLNTPTERGANMVVSAQFVGAIESFGHCTPMACRVVTCDAA